MWLIELLGGFALFGWGGGCGGRGFVVGGGAGGGGGDKLHYAYSA